MPSYSIITEYKSIIWHAGGLPWDEAVEPAPWGYYAL